jgi:hypothetical protein
MATYLACLVLVLVTLASAQVRHFAVSNTAADITTGAPLQGFVSYSIEFASFPDFAGKKLWP